MTISVPGSETASRSTSTSTVGYLGWSGRGNLGDDVLFEVVAEALPEVRFTALPMSATEIARGGLAGVRGRSRRPLVLGGGTAVGRKNWRAALRAATIACGAEHHLVGVGVEDPRFQGRHSFSSGGELARWRSQLRRFERVTVRGPNSAALLADVGFSAEVAGDPALLLKAPWVRQENSQPVGTLGISLGFGDDLWGHDHDKVVATVAAVALARARDGQQIVFLVVNPEDEVHAKAMAASLPNGTYRFEHPTDSAAFFAAIEDCQLVIAERLHAGILAVSAGVPTVMLEYQPKVRDFMESVDLGELCVRVDRVSAANLAELAQCATDDRDAQIQANARVARLRNLLDREVSALTTSVRNRLGLPDLRREQ